MLVGLESSCDPRRPYKTTTLSRLTSPVVEDPRHCMVFISQRLRKKQQYYLYRSTPGLHSQLDVDIGKVVGCGLSIFSKFSWGTNILYLEVEWQKLSWPRRSYHTDRHDLLFNYMLCKTSLKHSKPFTRHRKKILKSSDITSNAYEVLD